MSVLYVQIIYVYAIQLHNHKIGNKLLLISLTPEHYTYSTPTSATPTVYEWGAAIVTLPPGVQKVIFQQYTTVISIKGVFFTKYFRNRHRFKSVN